MAKHLISEPWNHRTMHIFKVFTVCQALFFLSCDVENKSTSTPFIENLRYPMKNFLENLEFEKLLKINFQSIVEKRETFLYPSKVIL